MSKQDRKFLKFIYSKKATNFCKISTGDLSYQLPVKSTLEISQNFVAFSEYMNFTKVHSLLNSVWTMVQALLYHSFVANVAFLEKLNFIIIDGQFAPNRPIK